MLAVVLEAGSAEAQTARRWSVQGFGGSAFADLSSDGRWAEAATKSDDEVLEFVRQTPGAIGYVSSARSPDPQRQNDSAPRAARYGSTT